MSDIYVKRVVDDNSYNEGDLQHCNSNDTASKILERKTKIIRDKESYLLYELLNDVKYLSTEQELDVPAIGHTITLKMFLVQKLCKR